MTEAKMFILGEDTVPEIAKLVGTPEASWESLLAIDKENGIKTRVVVVNRPQIDLDDLEEMLDISLSFNQWQRFNDWQDAPVDHKQEEPTSDG